MCGAMGVSLMVRVRRCGKRAGNGRLLSMCTQASIPALTLSFSPFLLLLQTRPAIDPAWSTSENGNSDNVSGPYPPTAPRPLAIRSDETWRRSFRWVRSWTGRAPRKPCRDDD